ncbi:NIC-domain-containing protein [Violaceomyces palustris]|uniref:NIC-domain-containing protein n=1 Tax=Violaceomyces palustris TaxID=1673888 RepID=A0ACD0P2J7_9BASI|nr:NIC-domain-containing protein [Violaceomyces palustris]
MNDYPMGSQPQTLAELLQQSRKLTNHLGRSDLPQIQLGLDQIENQSRKLVSKSLRSGTVQPGDARAHYFLANGGIDAAELADTINAANIANTFEPLQPIYDTDVESYLKHGHEQVILSAIEEGRRETLRDFHQSLDRTLHRDWERQKKRILEELGQHQVASGPVNPSNADFEATRSFGPSTSTQGLSRALPSSSTMSQMHGRMVRYDTVISRLNSSRLEGYSLALCHSFMDAIQGMGEDSKKKQLLDCWQAVSHMVGEQDVRDGEFTTKAVKERQYASAYVDTKDFNGPDGTTLKKRLTEGAKGYLQAQFLAHMEQVIASNPVQAQRGGIPTSRSLVGAFLRVQHMNSQGHWRSELAKDLDRQTSTPVWAVIYHLLRIGRTSEALDCAADNENKIRLSDPSFLAYFKAWLDSPDRRLPRLLRDRFFSEYNSRFRNVTDGQDPFKLALYKLIGRIDVSKKFPNLLTTSTENWLWLQLMMVRESYDDEADAQDSVRDRYTLADLGSKLERYGEAHFDPKGNRPLHYFQILLLCGQFEKAVAFLFSRSSFQVDAVHYAIGLAYYGLLRVPTMASASQVDILSIGTDPNHGSEVAYLDFAKLIQRYTRLFSQTSRRDALQYLYLICLSSDSPEPVGTEQVQRCHDLIRSLVLEAQPIEFQELLGDVRSNGVKTPGLIERHLALIKLENENEFLNAIVRVAARQCELEHRTESAILLYNLAGEHDTVVGVLNKELGATLMEPPTGGAAADWRNQAARGLSHSGASFSAAGNLVTLAVAILESYERQFGYSGSKRETCWCLLELKKAVGLHSQGDHSAALQTIESLRLLPLDAESRKDIVSITRKADEFKQVDENIARNFSEIVLMTMTILYKLHQELKESILRSGSGAMEEYRSQARALMMWAGMLRFRMSSETYSQLTRLDVFIH